MTDSLIGIRPGLAMPWFGFSTCGLRLVADGLPNISRRAAEPFSNRSRRIPEAQSNSTRTALEQHSNNCRRTGSNWQEFMPIAANNCHKFCSLVYLKETIDHFEKSLYADQGRHG
jgi:hypothetical protein